MDEEKPHRKRNIILCCHNSEEQDQSNNKNNRTNGVMLGQNIHSEIVPEITIQEFESTLTNKNIPIYRLLEGLYAGKVELSKILPLLKQKRINPEFCEGFTERDDLEFYIPQIVTYMVIECKLKNLELNELLIQACMTHFYFAHSVYFYLQSLSVDPFNGTLAEDVEQFLEVQFLPKMAIYSEMHLSSHQLLKNIIGEEDQIGDYEVEKEQVQHENEENSHRYGTQRYPDPAPEYPPAVEKVRLKSYNATQIGFMETPRFWHDLVSIGERIAEYPPNQRSQGLKQLLKKYINIRLPATTYIPFTLGTVRLNTILNVWEGRVFSTKERAPFSVWLQIYREEQEQISQLIHAEGEQSEVTEGKKQKKKRKFKTLEEKIYQTLSRPVSVADGANPLKIKSYMEEMKQTFKENDETIKKRDELLSRQSVRSLESNKFSLSEVYDFMEEIQKKAEMQEELLNDSEEGSIIKSQADTAKTNINLDVFPKRSEQIIEQYKKVSVYRNLRSWKMMHMMVKTGDDLRQEQFAMQLISKFQYIFQKQKVDCFVKPYQVVSLGPDFGLIEMLNDIITFDGLLKKLYRMRMSLQQFFDSYYQDRKVEAKRNFMKSLAGYCLVTYFLQVKDRHNGNILLHRDGSIIHIDFGFFLSSAPGKGIQLERKVPFKLLSQYTDVIGARNSETFFQFRQLFFKGFKAVLKHREVILSLVKMMYKSCGTSMKCFKRGAGAVEELEQRLNPRTEDLQNFCFELINNSLDNWRAKWYDKFQYFFQKIYY